MRSINKDFKFMSPSDLASFGATVEQNIAKYSLLFPSPVPAISELATTRLALKIAIAKSIKGSLVDRQHRNNLTEDYRFMLTRLAGYVAMEATDNDNALELSGFNLSRIRKSIGPLEEVANLRSTYGMFSGSLDMKWTPVHGAKSYVIEYTELNSEQSHNKFSSRTKLTLKFPKNRTDYRIRVAAIGTAGQGPWSQVLNAFVV